MSKTPQLTKILTVCEIADFGDISEGKLVRVTGRIAGYHEIFMFSDACSNGSHFIELQFDESERNRFLEVTKAYRIEKPDFRGDVTVNGRIYRGTGRLYTYPARRIDVDKPNDELESMTADKITNTTVENFKPE